MSETENNTHAQKPRNSSLAQVSFVLAIVGYPIMIGLFVQLATPSLNLIPSYWLAPPVIAYALLPILAIISIFKIRESRGRLKGMGFAIAAIVIPLALMAMTTAVAIMIARPLVYRIVCVNNLNSLRTAMVVYAAENADTYPTPHRWCDLLMEHTFMPEKVFLCLAAERGRSHYAINPDAEPNSPPDMVLLFETKAGWNQVGGPELLSFENHKGQGCNVAFNDTHVEFITRKQLAELKWKAEEGESKE